MGETSSRGSAEEAGAGAPSRNASPTATSLNTINATYSITVALSLAAGRGRNGRRGLLAGPRLRVPRAHGGRIVRFALRLESLGQAGEGPGVLGVLLEVLPVDGFGFVGAPGRKKRGCQVQANGRVPVRR